MPISPCWKLHHNKGDEYPSIHVLLAIHYRNLFHKCLLIWLYLQTTTEKLKWKHMNWRKKKQMNETKKGIYSNPKPQVKKKIEKWNN
jgi:hypothetical protein